MKSKGADHEIDFWKGFVKTERFLKGWCGNQKTPELNDFVYNFILENRPPKGMVLDCGSGVCSILNGTVPNDCLLVTDLLAEDYAKIFNYSKHDIVQPIALGCENIPEDYRNRFDIVHISNALDHVEDVMASYHNLLEAVKPGGYLIVQGFENEGKYENFQGFHQWNLSLTTTNQLRVEHRSGKIDYIDGAFETKRVWVEMLQREWFIFIVKK